MTLSPPDCFSHLEETQNFFAGSCMSYPLFWENMVPKSSAHTGPRKPHFPHLHFPCYSHPQKDLLPRACAHRAHPSGAALTPAPAETFPLTPPHCDLLSAHFPEPFSPEPTLCDDTGHRSRRASHGSDLKPSGISIIYHNRLLKYLSLHPFYRKLSEVN